MLPETKPKPEPWNPVQITFDLPVDAAKRLTQLAEGDDQALLRELGIISFQVQGEKVSWIFRLSFFLRMAAAENI